MQTPQEFHPQYQLAVIGSGSGGREAALLAARQGLRTALIEADKLGALASAAAATPSARCRPVRISFVIACEAAGSAIRSIF